MYKTLAATGLAAIALISGSAPVWAQSATNAFGSTVSITGGRGFTSYTYRNPQTGNNPTFPQPGQALIYSRATGGVAAFANQVNNTPSTSIPSYSGFTGPLNAVPGASNISTSSTLPNQTVNLTASSNANSSTSTNAAGNNAGFNNQGTTTSNTTGIINNFSGVR